MPYRHAHWYLLALFPLVVLAFWPGYFSIFSTAAGPLHAHAAAGSLWIGLLAAQSWLIHHGERDMHRQLGIASLAAFAFFVAASAGVAMLMAEQFANRISPIAIAFDPRLGLGVINLVGGYAYCYWQALRWRRKVHLHSRYLLATVLFLLPPIMVRLFRYVPFLRLHGPQDLGQFAFNTELGNGMVAALAFYLAWRSGKHGRPFAEAGVLIVVNMLLQPTIGASNFWRQIFGSLTEVPLLAVAVVAGLVGILFAYSGWIAGKRRAPAARTVAA